MKTIMIKRSTKDLLDEKIVKDEKMSMDKAINILLDLSEDKKDYVFDNSKTNINLHEPTLARLKEFKAYEMESNSNVILRLLQSL